jgi:hypothetical protein
MRGYRVLVVLCLLAGVVLRARGYLFASRPFWVDEAAWAIRLLKLSLLEPSIRPVGFMALVRGLVACFGERDVVLRLVPFAAGVGAMLLAVPLAEELLPNRAARLLFIGALALHPVAIDYSKEFKPYSVSLFVHILCTFLAARYLRTERTSTLGFGIVTGVLGVWFAQDVIFALPGYYLVTGALAWRRASRAHLRLLALGAASTLAMIGFLYFFFWRAVDVGQGGSDTTFWGSKYDVFHQAGTGEGLLHWVSRKYLELAAFPAARREVWQSDAVLGASVMGWLSLGYAGVWVLLHAAGLVLLVRDRRYSALTLLFAPIVTLLAFNLLGLWPFAVFRTNLFLLAYACLIAAFGIGAVRPLAELEQAVPLIVAVVLPLVAFERDWHAHKRWAGESGFFDVAKELVRLQGRFHGESDALVLDHWSCTVFRYYLRFNPDYAKLRHRLEQRFSTTCRTEEGALSEAEQEATSHHRVFLVLDDPNEGAATLEHLASLSNVVDYRKLDEGRDVVLEFAAAGESTQ